MKGFWQEPDQGDWLRRIDGAGSRFFYHRSDLGAKAYIYYAVLGDRCGEYRVKKGNVNSQMAYAAKVLSSHETLDGAKVALLVSLGVLT